MEKEKSNSKTRYIKTLTFDSINDVKNIEPTVNSMIDQLKEAGGKIVSIIPHKFGLSPMYLIYDIIYESESQILIEDKNSNAPKK